MTSAPQAQESVDYSHAGSPRNGALVTLLSENGSYGISEPDPVTLSIRQQANSLSVLPTKPTRETPAPDEDSLTARWCRGRAI